MAQFEVVEAVFESDSPVTKRDLKQSLDLHPSSVGAGITDCVQKGYITKTSEGYTTSDDFNKEKLESIRPKTIDELYD